MLDRALGLKSPANPTGTAVDPERPVWMDFIDKGDAVALKGYAFRGNESYKDESDAFVVTKWTPLGRAVHHGIPELVQVLLAKGLNQEELFEQRVPKGFGWQKDFFTPLGYACRRDDHGLVLLLLRAGANPETKITYEKALLTPLEYASKRKKRNAINAFHAFTCSPGTTMEGALPGSFSSPPPSLSPTFAQPAPSPTLSRPIPAPSAAVATKAAAGATPTPALAATSKGQHPATPAAIKVGPSSKPAPAVVPGHSPKPAAVQAAQSVPVSDPSFVARLCYDAEVDDNFNPISGLEGPLVTLEEAIQAAKAEPELGKVDLTWNVKAAKMFARKQCKVVGEVLTEHQIAAIQIYTQESPLYGILNRRLRERDRALLKPFFPLMRLLLSGLYALPAQKCTVHRGVKKALAHAFEKDDEKIWWSFTSATTHVEVLSNEQFLGEKGERTLFSIEAVHAVDIGKYSAVASEREMVLPPGTELLVVSKLSLGNGAHLVQLRQKPYDRLMQ